MSNNLPPHIGFSHPFLNTILTLGIWAMYGISRVTSHEVLSIISLVAAIIASILGMINFVLQIINQWHIMKERRKNKVHAKKSVK